MRNTAVVMLLSNPFKPDERVMAEARSLRKHGHKVTILAWDRELAFPPEEAADGISVRRIRLRAPSSFPTLVPFLLFFNVIVLLKLLKMDFDIIHCHDFDTLLSGFLIAKVRNKRIIYDSHEYYPDMIAPYVPRLISDLISALEGYIGRRCDAAIVVNERIEEIFRKKGVANTCVVMNCKDPAEYQVDSIRIERLRRELAGEGRFIILYDGWLVPEKGLEEMFEVVARLKNTPKKILLVVCGSGPMRNEYQRIVSEKGVDSFVNFVGEIPLKEIPVYVNSSDMTFVLYKPDQPNNFYSTPNRMFEAIMAGKPIIVSNFGELKRMVESNGFGIAVDPNDPTQISNAVLSIMLNVELRERLSKRARTASQVYNWPNMEKRLLRLYRTVCSVPN